MHRPNEEAQCSECNRSIELGKLQKNGYYYFHIATKKNPLPLIDNDYFLLSVLADIGCFILYFNHSNPGLLLLMFFFSLVMLARGFPRALYKPLFEIYVMEPNAIALIKVKKYASKKIGTVIIPKFKAHFHDGNTEPYEVMVPEHKICGVLNIEDIEEMLTDAKKIKQGSAI